jgi:hypothetical protein
VQVERDDRLHLLGVFAALDDLRDVLNEIAADEVATGVDRARNNRAALRFDLLAGVDRGEVVASNFDGRLLRGGKLGLQLRDLPLQRADVVRVVWLGSH